MLYDFSEKLFLRRKIAQSCRKIAEEPIKYVNLRPQEMQYTLQLSNEKDFRNVINSYSPAIGL